MSARYRFVVEGELSERALTAFPDLEAVPPHDGTTVLSGTIADSTAMRGILARFDSLGLTLVEMRQLSQ
ncbi:hypothetical protein ACFVMC_12705 [Nocardia sp. NPDC127579]|uniref:hypothetical protein n=1 Tax=Nocardia sp. NPDC127579 TaxID=3345402 RepID=UPI00362C88E2